MRWSRIPWAISAVIAALVVYELTKGTSERRARSVGEAASETQSLERGVSRSVGEGGEERDDRASRPGSSRPTGLIQGAREAVATARGDEETDPPGGRGIGFRVDGRLCESFTLLVAIEPDDPSADALERGVRWVALASRDAEVPLDSVAALDGEPTGIIACGCNELSRVYELRELEVLPWIDALPRGRVSGTIVEEGTGEPIAGAVVELRSIDRPEALASVLEAHSMAAALTTETDVVGRFELPPAPLGSYRLEARSHAHEAAETAIDIAGNADLGRALTLQRKEGVEVRLLGFDPDRGDEYEIAFSVEGERVPIEDDGTAWLPIDRGAYDLIVTVFCPGDLEVTAWWPNGLPSSQNSAEIRVGGGAPLSALVRGSSPVEQRLGLLAKYTSSLGYLAQSARWVAIDSEVALPECEGASTTFQVIYSEDRWPVVIALEQVDVSPTEPTLVTLDLPGEVHRLRITLPDGSPLSGATAVVALEGTGAMVLGGGTTDPSGEVIIPSIEEGRFFVNGSDGDAAHFLLDLLAAREAGEPLATLALERPLETRLTLTDQAGALMWNREVAVVGARTGCVAAYVDTGELGREATFAWFGNGSPAIQLVDEDVWSPRGPVPVTSGDVEIRVVLRADCTFATPGGRVVELLHVESDSRLQDLRADATVRIRDGAGACRCEGVPSGSYLVRLDGSETWHGPYALPPKQDLEFLVAAD